MPSENNFRAEEIVNDVQPIKVNVNDSHESESEMKSDSVSFLDIELPADMSLTSSPLAVESADDSGTKNIDLDKCHSPKFELTKKVVSHALRFNQSYKCMEEMAKVINQSPFSNVKIPDTKYKIKKTMKSALVPEFQIRCNTCKTYWGTTGTEVRCETCSQNIKRAKSTYFVSIPIKYQLMKILDDHFEEIIGYDQQYQDHSDSIRDIHDCIEYRRVKEKYQSAIILPLTLNTDGARAFNATNSSIWPLQLVSNFLRPNKRYITDNILVVGLHEGKHSLF